MSLARHRELLVLGAVRSHDLHGYALAEALDGGLGRGLALKRSTIYALLSRLDERGLIECRAEQDSARPERRVYRVTKDGRKTLAGLVHASARATVCTIVPLAIIVAHIDELPHAEAMEVLEACRDELQGTLDDLAEVPPHDGPGGIAFDLLRRHVELDLEAVVDLLRQKAATVRRAR